MKIIIKQCNASALENFLKNWLAICTYNSHTIEDIFKELQRNLPELNLNGKIRLEGYNSANNSFNIISNETNIYNIKLVFCSLISDKRIAEIHIKEPIKNISYRFAVSSNVSDDFWLKLLNVTPF